MCPGCGAYAPDIAPPSTIRAGTAWAAAPAAMDVAESTAPYTPYDGHPRSEAVLANTGPSGAIEDIEGVPPAPQGRAARRRQLARWKKNQRRAVVATAVALIGGGLTVASMDRNSGDQAQAASAPDDRTMGSADQPAAESTEPTGRTEPTRRTTTPPATHQSSRTTAPAQTPTANTPRQQSPTVTPRRTLPLVQSDAAAAARPSTTSAQPPQTTAPSPIVTTPDRDHASAEQPSAPPAAGAPAPGTSQPAPSATPSSPPQLCLLVICLG
nr:MULTISPECIES: hypothetical protein [Streptomyces]